MGTRRSASRAARSRWSARSASAPGEPTPSAARPGRIVLDRRLQEEILKHAMEEAPREACGVVVGLDGVGARVVRCRNVHPEPMSRYRVDPNDLRAILMPMEDDARELVAIYHSHPASPPVPSPTDRGEAEWPHASYILASWRTGAPELRAFRLAGEWMWELPLEAPGSS